MDCFPPLVRSYAMAASSFWHSQPRLMLRQSGDSLRLLAIEDHGTRSKFRSGVASMPVAHSQALIAQTVMATLLDFGF